MKRIHDRGIFFAALIWVAVDGSELKCLGSSHRWRLHETFSDKSFQNSNRKLVQRLIRGCEVYTSIFPGSSTFLTELGPRKVELLRMTREEALLEDDMPVMGLSRVLQMAARHCACQWNMYGLR